MRDPATMDDVVGALRVAIATYDQLIRQLGECLREERDAARLTVTHGQLASLTNIAADSVLAELSEARDAAGDLS